MSKFKKADQLYFKRRKQFSKKYGARDLWSVMDHWPLYCGVFNLARYLSIADIFKSTLKAPGDIAEFGCWRGAGIMYLAKLLEIFDPHSLKLIHAFDSFEGLNQFSSQDAHAGKQSGKYQGNYQEFMDVIKLFEMQRKVKIHKGYIEKTLPHVLKQNKALTFSFVYCDTDLYESTNCILHYCHSRMLKGSVFVLDEWNCEDYPGEGVAVNQFLKEKGAYYDTEHVRHTRQPTLVLRRIKS